MSPDRESHPLHPEQTPEGLHTFDVGAYRNLGPAVALLSERFSNPSPAPATGSWAAAGRPFTVEQMTHSAIEACVALAQVVGTQRLTIESPDDKPTVAQVTVEAARVMALLAQAFTRTGHQGQGTGETGTVRADDSQPGAAEPAAARDRARLCHEMSSFFLTGNGRPALTLTAADPEVAFSVAYALLEMAARTSGLDHAQQLDLLRIQSARAQNSGP